MELKIGKYRHFKGKEYLLIGVASHSETMEPMVVYNIPKGEWHHITVSHDATVLVVENSNTTKENSESKFLESEE